MILPFFITILCHYTNQQVQRITALSNENIPYKKLDRGDSIEQFFICNTIHNLYLGGIHHEKNI